MYSIAESNQSPLPYGDVENQTSNKEIEETNESTTTETLLQPQNTNEVKTSNETVFLSARNSLTTDSQSNSSEYDTPMSSEASPSSADLHVQIETPTPTSSKSVNGYSVVDSAPVKSSKKSKKKPTTTVAASIYSCFPMGCTGNMSPSFGLCRMDSVYGGVRSRLV